MLPPFVPSPKPLAKIARTVRLLLVEDSPTDALLARDALEHAVGVTFEVVHMPRLQAALDCLQAQTFDVAVLDLNLPDSDGLETFDVLHAAAPDLPVVVVSHRAGEELALLAVQGGAQDYLVKGEATGLLVRTVRYALERAQSQLAQRNSEARLASVIESAMDAIISVDPAQCIVLFNAAAEKMFGTTAAEVMGQRLDRLIPLVLRTRHQSYVDEFAVSGVSTRTMCDLLPLTALRANGEEFPIEASISKAHVSGQMLLTAIVRDISVSTRARLALEAANRDLERTNAALDRVAHYDALTGLPNRVLLAERLLVAMERSEVLGRSLAVAFIDLDGFKPINDTYGHHLGNDLLVEVAQRIKAVLRPGDCLARMGGDEFVAVLGDLEVGQDCEPLLDDILRAVAVPVVLRSQTLSVTASIGVTVFPQDGDDADRLVRHADQAMHLAKQAGRNRHVVFDTAQAAQVSAQRESFNHIQQAITHNELVLYYQPKVHMRTGEVIGAEALIRWQHPERGLLPPAAFLPAIEGHALSISLGEWVIDAALAQMAAWQAQGLELSVSVNIGSLQLQHEGFVAHVAGALARYPTVPPQRLEIEILETSALQDIAHVSSVVRACQALGVRFALDDFGTGYSSLSYLKRLPAELIKIDQSFIRDMLGDVEDLAIVKGVIGLARAFNREVIAEGVETTAHGCALLLLDCALAQGYGIARPMPADALPHWLASWQPDPAWKAGPHTPQVDALLQPYHAL